MENAIEVINVSKKYPSGFEIKDMSFEIKKGYITGVIGKNGAGKTTIIKLILDILHADKGSVKIFEKDVKSGIYNVNEDIGIVIEDIFFPDELKVRDLDIVSRGIIKKWNSDLFYKYIDKFDIAKNSKIKELSTGMKKKLQIVYVLSYSPKLLIFDEATSGLDPIVRREILDVFSEYMRDEENTILMSTHITTDLDDIADEIIMMDDGKIVFKDFLDNIKNEYCILKCDEDMLRKLDEKTVLAKISTKYSWEVLVNNKNELSKNSSNYVLENINLEKMMFLLSKGV